MSLSRRHFIALTAIAAGCSWPVGLPAFAAEPILWRGNALGADASLQIFGADAATGRRLIAECLAEVDRLEQIFSLYREDSSLVRLNRSGRLDAPPAELVEILALSRHCSELSGGAFDVTVQPLWELHAAHFASPGADPHGPPEQAIRAARRLVDWRGVTVGAGRISFDRPAMAVTLNSVGQGYVTDKVAELLRRRGMAHVLVDMGEISCIGSRPDGAPWRVGLEKGGELPVIDRAVATSSPDGTRFSPFCHHIFDPGTGHSSRFSQTVTVVARTATLANAISTAICAGGPKVARSLSSWAPDARVHRSA